MNPSDNNDNKVSNPLNTQPAPITPSLNPAQPISPAVGKTSFISKFKQKKFLIPLIAVLVLFAGSVGAYFGIIVPNKPENIWEKSLSNTSKGYDKLVTYSKDHKDIKGGKLTGNFKYNGEVVVDGSIDSKFYENNSSTKIDVGAAGARFNLEILTKAAANSKNPDIYAKVSGLKGIDTLLGESAAGVGQSLEAYDNQWYVIDHTLLDQLEKEATQQSEGEGQSATDLTKDDIIGIAEAIGRVNKEYLLSTDPNKAVLKVVENVGKETVDGRSVYHYKVGYDKNNLKAYANAMKDELKNNTKLKDIYKGQDFEKAIGFDETIKSIDELDDNGQADVWVDIKTKIIRTVRFTDKEKQDNYFEVGLHYVGGDEYPFVLGFNTKEEGSEAKGSMKVIANFKNSTVKFEGNVDGKDNDKPIKVTFNALLEQNNDQVNVEAPANAKSLMEIFGSMFGAGSLGGIEDDQGIPQACIEAYQQLGTTGNISSLPPECQ